ncbi:sodium:alanine symporter family protein [uncultured Treponema sp.]|uniref:alanine/glycine:cation symporter family protein n=1 Tax=uncultured Treponema sp. TaxID=162155 RepID=UPI0015B9BE83|nr:sodium:alanine symporter family protein [uncultured Treponema sp.]
MTSSVFTKINSVLDAIDGFVWGLPLIILILVTGIFLTVRLRGVQFSQLKFAIKSIFRKSDAKEGGELSSFKSLCTALSATIGTGNIVGVATAIALGGPGALFWMWLAALLGMATKYSECLLSIHFREVKEDGHILGGPFYTCEKGVGAKFPRLGKILAVLFAVFGTMVGLFGIGTFSQVNSISTAINSFAKVASGNSPLASVTIPGIGTYSLVVVIASIVLAVLVALVIIGGVKRISTVAGIIVPAMAVIYVVFGVLAVTCNLSQVTSAFEQIFQGAFGFKAAAGGAVGAMIVAMQKGIARGIFSNEAGLGSAPIAASAAKVDYAVQQGIISMTGTFFDTIVICTVTGLVIVISGTWRPELGLAGFEITNAAFQTLLPRIPGVVISFILMLCLVLFAFTTILGWDYYSERCIEYLSKGKMTPVKIYRWLYIAAIFAGPYMTVSAVWTIADIVNGLMAIPNIISLLVLNGIIVKLTADYFSGKRIYSIGYDFWNNPIADEEQN